MIAPSCVPPPDHQVLLAAFAAERQRQQDLPAGSGLLDLVVPGDVPACSRPPASRRPCRPWTGTGAAGTRTAAGRSPGPWRGTRPAGSLQRLLALRPVGARLLGQLPRRRPARSTGLRRARLPSSSRSSPNVVSIQDGERVADQVCVADGRGGRVDPLRGHRPGVLVGGADRGSRRSRCFGSPACRRSRSRRRRRPVRRCAPVPSVDMVAEVPTHCTSGAAQASFTRRMSIATSAPCRPR